MAKKQDKSERKTPAPGALFDGPLADAVKESAQQIWLAGMGAFAKAQAEGGKMFDSLVREGTQFQRRTQADPADKVAEAASRMGAMAADMGMRAGSQWDRLESIFEERTAKALAKLGVPTLKDVQELGRRVDELQAEIAALATVSAPAPAPAPVKKAAARKPAAKTAAKTVRRRVSRGSAPPGAA